LFRLLGIREREGKRRKRMGKGGIAGRRREGEREESEEGGERGRREEEGGGGRRRRERVVMDFGRGIMKSLPTWTGFHVGRYHLTLSP